MQVFESEGFDHAGYQVSRESIQGRSQKKNAQVINEREIIFYIKDYKINKNDGVYFGIFL